MATLTIDMDDGLTRKFDKVCRDLGLTMTSVFTMLAQRMSIEKKLPFAHDYDDFYSPENIAELESRIESVRNGTSILKEHELLGAN